LIPFWSTAGNFRWNRGALVSQGGATWGYTKEEALANIGEAVRLVVESLKEHGDPIPTEPAGLKPT